MTANSDLKNISPELFFITLFERGERRNHISTIHIFSHELNKIYLNSRDSDMIRLIKFKWWHNAIIAVYQNTENSQTPILHNMQNIITHYNIPKELFIDIFAAHTDYFDNITNKENLLEYAGRIGIFRLLSFITGTNISQSQARNLSIITGITDFMLRTVAYDNKPLANILQHNTSSYSSLTDLIHNICLEAEYLVDKVDITTLRKDYNNNHIILLLSYIKLKLRMLRKYIPTQNERHLKHTNYKLQIIRAALKRNFDFI